MSRTYPIGTADVPLVIAVDNQGPIAGLTVTAKIIRHTDEAIWDWSDNTFKASGVVQPTETLPASPSQSGLYVATWDISGISVDTEVSIIYQSTATEVFIEEESIHLVPAASVSASLTTMFLEAVIDKTMKTLTVLFGLSDDSGLVVSTAAVITISDELGNVLFSSSTTSSTGIHRKVFPQAQLIPNRILTAAVDFTVGVSTVSRIQALKVLGAA